jgi:hypothetical protein
MMNETNQKLIIGVDLDNTIINFNELIYQISLEKGLIPINIPKDKKNIRDVIRNLPSGDIKWQKIQSIVYGEKIFQASLFPGVVYFFQFCKKHNIPLYIISHKTQFSNLYESQIDLRKQASEFLKLHHLLPLNKVYFESNRLDKVKRIKKIGCNIFIDDLIEIFDESTFPIKCIKILFDPRNEYNTIENIKICKSWYDLIKYVQSQLIS